MAVPPPTLEERSTLGADPTFRARCQSAALQAATDVMAEPPDTHGHEERTAYANKVLLNPSLQSQAIAFGVAAAPAIHEASTDSDVQFTINSLWDAWSGVSAAAP
jgi:hypothetical protein